MDTRPSGSSALATARWQQPRRHVVAYDYGVKRNILRMLAEPRLPRHGGAGADAALRKR